MSEGQRYDIVIYTADSPHVGRFMRSHCCNASVIQWREFETDLRPVMCLKCGATLEVPGGEDVAEISATSVEPLENIPPYSVAPVDPPTCWRIVRDGCALVRQVVRALARQVGGG